MALAQALLHPFSHVRWDEAPDLFQIRPGKSILSKCGLHNIIIEPKECLRGLLDTRIFTRESCHKQCILTARIELSVDGTLRENSHLIRAEFVGDTMCAVLEGELCDKAAFDDDIDFGAARVGVGGIETARADEAKCHGDSGANEGREDLTICTYGVTALTGCHGALWWVVEVVDKVGVIGDQVDAIFRCGRECERLY